MGLFAFRRLRDREVASTEAASLSIAEPAPTLEPKEPPNDGSSNRRNRRVGKRQLLSDSGGRPDDR